MQFGAVLLLLGLAGGGSALALQNPASAGRATTDAAPDKKSKKEIFKNQFLIFGTVFTERGFSLPGAEIGVRRAGERKVRWEARSDRRGEFALRVPMGAEYEMTVSAKGYQRQSRKMDARVGSREDVVFRLQPIAEGKK